MMQNVFLNDWNTTFIKKKASGWRAHDVQDSETAPLKESSELWFRSGKDRLTSKKITLKQAKKKTHNIFQTPKWSAFVA